MYRHDLMLVTLLLALGACRIESGLNAIQDEPLAPIEDLTAPKIELSTLAIDFGELAIPGEASETVEIRNVGDAELEVISIEGDSTAFRWKADAPPFVMAVDEVRVLTVTYTPDDFVSDESLVVIGSTDPDQPEVAVALMGTTLEPELVITPVEHDFGAMTLGVSASQIVTVENLGPSDAVLEDLTFWTSSTSELRLIETAGLDASPLTLAATESVAFRVYYEPGDTLADESSLEVTTNVPSQPAVVARQVGTGVEPGDCDPDGLPFGGGTGTEEDPHTLCAPAHVDNVRVAPSDNFLVVQDIDLASLAFEPIASISGDFDGGGFTLSDLTMRRPTDGRVALFRELARGAVLHDVTLADPVVVASVGAAPLFADALDGSRVEDVIVTGANVTANSKWAAGLGHAVREGATIDGAFSEATVVVKGEGFAGGMIGSCSGTCRRLVAEGSVDGGGWKAGGMFSHTGNGALIEQVVSRVDVKAGSRIGGLIAVVGPSTIRDCYAEGTLSSGWWVGGLFSHSYAGTATVERCYANTPITSGPRSGCDAGGIFSCLVDATVTASVWDINTTGETTTVGGGNGLSTSEMQDPSNAAFSTWGSAWVLSPGSYPRLAIE